MFYYNNNNIIAQHHHTNNSPSLHLYISTSLRLYIYIYIYNAGTYHLVPPLVASTLLYPIVGLGASWRQFFVYVTIRGLICCIFMFRAVAISLLYTAVVIFHI